MARLSILTQDEINALYEIPMLDGEERSFLFSLDIDDVAILESFDNTARKVDYIHSWGITGPSITFSHSVSKKLKLT